MVVRLLVLDPPGRQLLCRRGVLQCLRLLRIGRKAFRRRPPQPGADHPGRTDRARSAAGVNAGSLRPAEQQLLQSQRGQAGRQAAQLARARLPRADRDAQLRVRHFVEYQTCRRGFVPLRQERLFGPDVDGRPRPAPRLLPLSAQLLHEPYPPVVRGHREFGSGNVQRPCAAFDA